uniref:Putative cytochrome n=1 Tax=Corethrella appendiculata TaxID=1370023 RepID=U5ENT2_9DIPT
MIEFYIAIIVLVFCLYQKWKCSYWKRRNVAGPAPLPIFGNLIEYIFARKHSGEVYDEIFAKYKFAAYVGIYRTFNEPVILVRDLELVKEVLVGGFQSFNANDFYVDEKIDPLLARNPFSVSGTKWKENRNLVSPIFSAAKVKGVIPIINGIADDFVTYIDRELEKNVVDFEAKDICSKYTINVVASCVFGVEGESFTNPDAEFCQMGRDVFKPSFRSQLVVIMSTLLPSLNKVLRVPFIPDHVDKWFRNTVKQVQKLREKSKKNDLFQLMLDTLEHKGTLSEDDLVGHSVTFLTEGFETSSTLMTYLLYELASHPDAQRKVQNEIDSVSKEYGFTDEGLHKLEYLDRAMHETLRLHSPVYTLSKVCTKEYKLPPQYDNDKDGTTIQPGTTCIIPVHAIHKDDEIYPNPYRFDPDRFTKENIEQRHRYSFLGFGEGPRICLGMKFGLAQSKMGIAKLLAKYSVKISAKQEMPLQFSKKTLILTSENGVWINFVKREF